MNIALSPQKYHTPQLRVKPEKKSCPVRRPRFNKHKHRQHTKRLGLVRLGEVIPGVMAELEKKRARQSHG
jgi:hypothetical protein